jgi:hypothetical protein
LITETKHCRSCNSERPITDFSKHSGPYYRLDCNDCRGIKRRQNYDADRNTNSLLKSKYGITLAEYDAMAKKQDGKCAICESAEPKGNGARFAIDHSHKTGKVRGLLCGPCNTAIGKFQDDIAILQSAIEYLRDHADV